ncbi:MAG: acyl--CoA ligase [Sphingomonas sp.]|uniref:class I adenylate-forming enzyme family protein n=1 Tax=Sphingomonas sp. TaxID=28214 RepID=UPI001AC99D96|nr:class I adenylate-forming enzyme family protein [Sphingomonas sp.]MBN8814347.1 acyl--CoA ligase [Sphingomonas sp.]
MTAEEILERDFGTLPDLIRAHADARGSHPALIEGGRTLTYRDLDRQVDRAAAALQRDGVSQGQAVAIMAANSIDYVIVYIAALRVGAVPALIAPSSSADSALRMMRDAGSSLLFADGAAAAQLPPGAIRPIGIGAAAEAPLLQDWMAPEDVVPAPAAIAPGDAFNIIYSSGTTGEPKGIVQSHRMRWHHIWRGRLTGYAPDAVTLISTPLYSNTTLVSLIPALSYGGSVVIMPRFDARRFLELAEKHRVTHAMLVPVQYRRLLADPAFDRFDLSAFRMKTCTSAPFGAALKAEVLQRWPGGLIDIYGMTEGGGTMTLVAHLYPDKLHTVGKPVDGHDVRLIDDDGVEVPPGGTGEVVGRSIAMMTHYHNQPAKSRDAEWHDPQGNRFIRTGDVGRFDKDGFLTLVDRKKDMIISGGFNIYPSDLEAVIATHPAVADCTVIGVESDQWGETPVGFYVARDATPAEEILAWTNARLGKTQRLSALHPIDELPRSAIGKVLKRELRDRIAAARQAA